MAEITIGGIGLVGLLALFQTCNRAYDVFVRSAKNLGKDAHRLGVNLEVEKQKFRLWGQYLGISSAGQCRLLRAESFETQKMAIVLLDAIKAVLDDIEIIMVRYGVEIVEASEELGGRNFDIGLEGLNLENIRTCEAVKLAGIKREATERSILASTSRLGKLRWALNDNKKLDKLVQDLRKINEDLWMALPVKQWHALAKGLPSVVLPEIHDQAMLLEVGGNARGNERTQLLAACAELRNAAITSAANESNPSFGAQLLFPSSCVVRSISLNTGDPNISNEAQRQLALVSGIGGTPLEKQVVIEWRYVDREFNFNEKQMVRSRIKSLAVLLSSQRSSEFGLLKCIGFYKDDQPLLERYGLLFEIQNRRALHSGPTLPTQDLAQFRPRSLYEYISSKKTPPVLGDRFRMASALCNTVLQLHASGWLHKAIRSSNVIFFPAIHSNGNNEIANLDIARPFLMGFDYSRPDRQTADSLDAPSNRTFNDYRHPALWAPSVTSSNTRYRKEFDIYAVGVILLEIGMWKLVRSIDNEHRDPQNPERWKRNLLKYTESLGYRCGSIYQDAVTTCLTGSFTADDIGVVGFGSGSDEHAIKSSFLFDVVYKLGNCFA